MATVSDPQKNVVFVQIDKMSACFLDDKLYSVTQCNSEPSALFVFADNDTHMGNAGLACIRNCTNAMGIPLRKSTSWDKTSYYLDSEQKQNEQKISKAIQDIKDRVSKDKMTKIYFPATGLGTGLAMLIDCAPKTFAFLCTLLDKEFHIANGQVKIKRAKTPSAQKESISQKNKKHKKTNAAGPASSSSSEDMEDNDQELNLPELE